MAPEWSVEIVARPISSFETGRVSSVACSIAQRLKIDLETPYKRTNPFVISKIGFKTSDLRNRCFQPLKQPFSSDSNL